MKLHGDVVKARLLAAVLPDASVPESEGRATPRGIGALRGKPGQIVFHLINT
jgi:hypothetical protein